MKKIKKKSQGMPINTIIVAILGIIILVVLLFIFREKMKESTNAISSCASKGGECAKQDAKGDYQCTESFPIRLMVSDEKCKASGICCLPAK